MKKLKINNEEIAKKSILKESESVEGKVIEGYDFNNGVNYEKIIDSFSTMGFQASHLSKAIDIVNEMIQVNSKIFLGYTSNMVSSGMREIIRYLVQNKKVDVCVTSGGGFEEDIIKCLGETVLGDFRLSGKDLREKGINRIGNLLVPNNNYILYGSFGDMVYFFKYKRPDFKVDVAEETKQLNESTFGVDKSGVLILGAGLVKHAILNAHLYRDGADYAVYINNAQEFDGSDAGALPEEAISWGKLKPEAKVVKVYGDATIIFPLLVAKTFAKK